jgi:hypothetical protein
MILTAQTNSLSRDVPIEGMYLIPQTIYVGDRGRLVLPLGAAYAEIESIVITESHLLPIASDIVISRIEIDKRTGGPRLLVDFRAYAPGLLELPPLSLGAYEFTGLKVEITSILEAEDDRVLSDAAPPMPLPGTLMLVYGSIIALVLFLLFALLFAFRGIPYMRMLKTYRRRRSVIRALRRSIHKMRNAIAKNALLDNSMLTHVSQDFRTFLSFFTKINCFTMTPKEISALPKMMLHPMIHQSELKGGEVYIFDHPEILYRIFKHCDDLRFSGNAYGKESVIAVLDSIDRFIIAFESYEKEPSRKISPRSDAKEAAS